MKLEDIRHSINNNPDTSNYIDGEEWDKISSAIAKELMGCLPDKYDVKSELDVGSEFSTPRFIRQNGYNQALDEVRARLTAFIGREK